MDGAAAAEHPSAPEECPGQGAEARLPATAGQPATATVEDMASNHGLALVRQKEWLVAALRPLPSGAQLAPQPSAPGALRPPRQPRRTSWTHGFARLDVSGRVRDAVLFDALGWRAGDALTIGIGSASSNPRDLETSVAPNGGRRPAAEGAQRGEAPAHGGRRRSGTPSEIRTAFSTPVRGARWAATKAITSAGGTSAGSL